MNRQRTLTLFALAPLALACGERSPGSKGSTPLDDSNLAHRSVETFATPLEVIAGEQIIVRCVVRDKDEHLPGVAIAVNVASSANAGSPIVQDDKAIITPQHAGEHEVHCSTADGGSTDPVGVRITVHPGSGVVAETRLEMPQAQAGHPVAVLCDIFDSFGNRVPDGQATGVHADNPLEVRRTPGNNYTVRGTETGEFDVACELDGVLDPTPASFMVVPGIPAATRTIVTPAHARPTETVSVSCEVTDAYGNTLSGYSSSFYLWPSHGGTEAQNGVEHGSHSFSATRAGLYYVFCNVPGFQAGDESPESAWVHPGQAYSMVADLLEQDCYWQNRRIPLIYEVFDQWGNKIDPTDPNDNFDLQLVATPSNAVVPDGQGNWIVVAEGDIDLALTPVGTDVHPGLQPEYFNIRVDSTPPVVNISYPSRAQMITAGNTNSSNISVVGSAHDSVSPLVSLQVGTSTVAVPGTSSYQTISVSQSSRWGMNVISAVAEDECGNVGVTAQSYIRSGQYASASTVPTVGARMSKGLVAQLNQPVIDNGNRNVIDDIATLAWEILRATDLNALLPVWFANSFAGNPAGATCNSAADAANNNGCVCHNCWLSTDCYWQGYQVRRTGPFTYNTPVINHLRAINGGASLSLRMDHLALPLHVGGWFNSPCTGDYSASRSGTLRADRVAIAGRIGISNNGTVTICNTCLDITLTNLRVNIDWGIFNFMGGLLDGIINLVLNIFRNQVANLLEGLVRSEVPALLSEVLENFQVAESFTLPPPINMSLNISSGLEAVHFCGPQMAGMTKPSQCPATNPPAGQGFGNLGLYTQVYPSSKASYIPWGMGAPRRNVAPPDFSNTAYKFGLGLSDDVINQVLWALWFGGGLDLNLTEILALAGGDVDLSGIDMSLRAFLPPVVMPGGFSDQMLVGLGDVYVDATVNIAQLLGQDGGAAPPIKVGMYLSAFMYGGIGLDPATNALQIHVDSDPSIFVEVVEIDDPGYQAVMSTVFTQLLSYIVPRLLDAAIGSFPIPEFNLTNLSGLELNGQEAIWRLQSGQINRKAFCFGAPFYMCNNLDAYSLTGDLH